MSSSLRNRRVSASSREYPFEELKVWAKEPQKKFAFKREPLRAIDANRPSVGSANNKNEIHTATVIRPPPLETDCGADAFLPDARRLSYGKEEIIDNDKNNYVLSTIYDEMAEGIRTPNRPSQIQKKKSAMNRNKEDEVTKSSLVAPSAAMPKVSVLLPPTLPTTSTKKMMREKDDDQGVDIIQAAEVAGLAAVRERDRLDATCKALGAQLVAAVRESEKAMYNEARQAAEAAEGRLAFAAAFETAQFEWQCKMENNIRIATEDVVAKAALKFSEAKSSYLKVLAERDALQRDHERVMTLNKQDLEKLQHELILLRSELSERTEREKRARTERRNLLDKVSNLNDTNAALSREVADLRAISDELIAMVESKQEQKSFPAPSSSSSSTTTTTSDIIQSHQQNHFAYTKHRRSSVVATPGGLRDLALP